MAGLFDPNARMHLPDGMVVEGRDAIREVYAALFAQSTTISLTTRFATEMGDLALLSCSWVGVSTQAVRSSPRSPLRWRSASPMAVGRSSSTIHGRCRASEPLQI